MLLPMRCDEWFAEVSARKRVDDRGLQTEFERGKPSHGRDSVEELHLPRSKESPLDGIRARRHVFQQWNMQDR